MNNFHFYVKNIFNKCCVFIKNHPVICSFFPGLLAKSAFTAGQHTIMLVLSVEIFYFILNHLYTTKSYGRSLLVGYMYGLGLYAGILYWETYLHDYSIGDLSQMALSLSFYLVSILYVAVFYSFATYLSVKLAFNKFSLLSFWAIFITLAEILQGFICPGYPFTIIAYGTIGIPYFSNIAAVFGSYGVTFLFLFILALVNVKKTFHWGVVTFFIIITYGVYNVSNKKNLLQQENNFGVIITQPNFDYKTREWGDYRQNCDDIAAMAKDVHCFSEKILLLTPETIIANKPGEIKYFQQTLLGNNDIYAMTGFLEKYKKKREPMLKDLYYSSNDTSTYNVVHVYRRNQLPEDNFSQTDKTEKIKFESVACYKKKYLIPFGEFLPNWFLLLSNFFPDRLTENLFETFHFGGLDGGDDDNTIKLSGIDQFDMNICYDIVLPGKSMSDPLGSTWIVNVINLHNYCSSGISDIAHQQNVMCRFRAMEFGKPIAVCANFGYSCFIDCNGQIIKILTPNKKGTLSLHFPLKYRITTFCKYKNALLYIIIFILVSCMLCYKILYHRKNNEHL